MLTLTHLAPLEPLSLTLPPLLSLLLLPLLFSCSFEPVPNSIINLRFSFLAHILFVRSQLQSLPQLLLLILLRLTLPQLAVLFFCPLLVFTSPPLSQLPSSIVYFALFLSLFAAYITELPLPLAQLFPLSLRTAFFLSRSLLRCLCP